MVNFKEIAIKECLLCFENVANIGPAWNLRIHLRAVFFKHWIATLCVIHTAIVSIFDVQKTVVGTANLGHFVLTIVPNCDKRTDVK